MTTAIARFRGASLVRGFNAAIMGQTVALSEYRVALHASSNPNFLTSFDGGACDCGVWVGEEPLAGSNTDKLFKLRNSHLTAIVPLDIKTAIPKADLKGNIIWAMTFTVKQYHLCGAIILTSPYEPDFVALIPMEYIRRRMGQALLGDCRLEMAFKGVRPAWTLLPLPPFPPEIAPYMMPLGQLGNAIAGIRNFTRGTFPAW